MNENDIKNAAEQAGKALGDASQASNDFVQKEGPAVADKIRKVLPYVFGALVLIVLFAVIF